MEKISWKNVRIVIVILYAQRWQCPIYNGNLQIFVMIKSELAINVINFESWLF